MRNLATLRNMVQKPRQIYALRTGGWEQVSTATLVPGDIVSVVRSAAEDDSQLCPCDLLLLEGQVVVNEAILTGETTPQIKVSQNQFHIRIMFGGVF
jgi:cation-transporting ATPase 13A1